MGHPCVPPPPGWLKKCALPLDFRAKTAQDARHLLGGAFGGYANDRIAHLAQEAYPAQEPPPFLGGERSAQARKKASEGHPQKVVTVVTVVTSWGFAS